PSDLEEFVANYDEGQRERFDNAYNAAQISQEDLEWFRERARREGGPIRTLVINENWCGDGIFNLALLGRINAETGAFHIRVIYRDAGKCRGRRKVLPHLGAEEAARLRLHRPGGPGDGALRLPARRAGVRPDPGRRRGRPEAIPGRQLRGGGHRRVQGGPGLSDFLVTCSGIR